MHSPFMSLACYPRRRWVGALLVALWLGCLGGEPRAQGPISAGDPQDPVQQQLIEDVQFRGNRRIPTDTLRLYVTMKQGDLYSAEQAQRDYQAVLAQGFFDPLRSNVILEPGNTGGVIVVFNLTEYPVVRDILYEGLKSIQVSDLLTRFKEKRISITKDSPYDPVQVKRAETELKSMLSERGRPNAVVTAEIEDVSKTSVVIIFNVDEGGRVRVAKIEFEGNQVFSSRLLRKQMKYTKQSSFLTRFNSKDVYSPEKFETDMQLVSQFLREKGYLRPTIGTPRIENIGKVGGGIPILSKKADGLRIVVPIDEGIRYRFGEITSEGSTIFTPEQVILISGMRKGDVASAKTIREGVYERLKKAYGSRGYIQADVNVQPKFKPPAAGETEGVADFTIYVEEGSVYTVEQIEFAGNNTTRDKVLRRELLVSEGEPYNQELMEYSILLLNQLGYFDEIKKEDIQTTTDERRKTVNVVIKVKERGRQQIQFSGGVSGIGGSFIGLTYSTNNLFGYGQSVSVDIQAGNLFRNIALSYNDPYFLDRRIGLGVSVFSQRFRYASGISGAAIAGGFFNSFTGLDERNLFTQDTTGASLSFSSPLAVITNRFPKLSRVSRLGVSYSYSASRITDPPVNRDADPNNDIIITFAQPGITISSLTPSFVYNTVNNPINPTSGRNVTFSFTWSGLGGKVKTLAPLLEYREFRPFRFLGQGIEKPAVLGMRFRAAHVSAYGTPFDSNSLAFIGGVPQFNRFYTGGEFEIRGYGIRTISPVAPIEDRRTTTDVRVIDGLTGQVLQPGLQVSPTVIQEYTYTDKLFPLPLGSFQFIPVGGDSQLLLNLEYRIPLVGPLSLALFADGGSAFNVRSLSDQSIRARALPATLGSTPDSPLPGPIILRPDGTRLDGTRPNDPNPGGPLPDGFRVAFVQAQQATRTQVNLSQTLGGIGRNFRASVGAEIQVNLPVLQVPFRLIFAYNPGAKTNVFDPRQLGIVEERGVIRFTVGRTF
ncbi:MAG: outer membrane protein assembly factor BamA [Chloracidobacterium sp. CP2_5A]|nr:MAG: outer membrane protein assembly factor BamA [Chloracidobacterium sp. CP2_5A]